MNESKKTTEELITSLYNFTKSGFEEMHSEFKKIDTRFDNLEVRFERLEDKVDDIQKSVNSHENRITRLEDSNRVIKTHLKLS